MKPEPNRLVSDIFLKKPTFTPLRPPQKQNKKRRWVAPRSAIHAAYIVSVFGALTIVFFGTRFVSINTTLNYAFPRASSELAVAYRSYYENNPLLAQRHLDAARILLDEARLQSQQYGVNLLASAVTHLTPQLEGANEALIELENFADVIERVMDSEEYLLENGLRLIVSGQGTELRSRIQKHITDLNGLVSILNILKASETSREYGTIDDLLAFQVEILNDQAFLKGVAQLLEGEKNLALVLTNPNDVRPGGGLPALYARVPLTNGSLGPIQSATIYDIDAAFKPSVVPPEPLQSVSKVWRAHDTLWFLDMRESSQALLSFLERSTANKTEGQPIEGVVLISTSLLPYLLNMVDGVTIQGGGVATTISGTTVGELVTRELSRSTITRTKSGTLAAMIEPLLRKIGALDSDSITDLAEVLAKSGAQKDIALFFKDSDIQRIVRAGNLDGGLADEAYPEYVADYFATTHTLVGSERPVRFESSISIHTTFDVEGKPRNTVRIGHETRDSVRDAKMYVEFYVPEGAKVQSASGFTSRPALPAWDYTNFETYVPLATVEATRRKLNSVGLEQLSVGSRSVVGGWKNVNSQQARTLELSYELADVLPLTDGALYRFAFDKQPSVPTNLSLVIDAPAGFKWRESDSTSFTYTTDSAPGSVSFILTLVSVR